jgi:hypothetical protein
VRFRRRQWRDKTYYLPATKLAAMGHCETKILLEKKLGDRATPEQAVARKEGSAMHTRFDRVVRVAHNRPLAQARDKRCFVATCVYGAEDARTEQLREYRDRVLAHVFAGRALISIYYVVSPWIVRLLERCPGMKEPVRHMLDGVRRRIRA